MKNKRKQPAIAALAMASAVFWCMLNVTPAAAGLFDDEQARKQIAEQQKRTEELRQQNEALAARLAKVEDSLKVQPVLELASQLELLRQELSQLRGQIEVLGNNIEGTGKRQRDMYVDLDSRLRRLEQPGTALPAGVPPAAGVAPAASVAPSLATAPPSAAGTPAVPASVSATAAAAAIATAAGGADARAYESAQNQRRIGNYRGAIVAFQSFITQYPKSELAPRAQYWIGDSYYNLRDFKSAITQQQKLISSYPDSTTVPDALLNIASSQMELGDAATARRTLDGLVSRYPTTEAAEKAKRRLATLK